MKNTFIVGILALALFLLSCKKGPDGDGTITNPEKFVTPSAARIAQLSADGQFAGFVLSAPDSRKVRVYNTAGELTNEFAVQGSPLAVAAMDSGEILVGDTMYQRIDKYSASGEFMETICGNIKMPGDIALYKKGNKLYVTDGKDNSVKECFLEPNSFGPEAIVFIAGFGAGDSFNFPSGIAVDENNDQVLVSDFMKQRIVIFSVNGTFLKTIEKQSYPPLKRPQGISLDAQGNIYVTDVIRNFVMVFDSAGEYQTSIGEYGSGPGQLRIPMDVIITPDDRILVTNGLNKRIEVY